MADERGAPRPRERLRPPLVDLVQGGFARIAPFALPALRVVARIPVYIDEMRRQ